MRFAKSIVFAALFAAVPQCASAQSDAAPAATSAAAAPVNPYKGAYLFGDWGGSRLKMAQHGVNFDAIFTQFGQGLSGQPSDTVDNYANKFDLYLNVVTEKAHLWSGGGIGAHAEIRYGSSPQGLQLFPANTALYTPTNGPNHVGLTSLYFTQRVNQTSALIFGKINPVDLLATSPFVGGRGLDGFMHIAFAAPPSGVTPVSTYGIISSTRFQKMGLTVFVFDPHDQTTSTARPFKEGVNFNVSASFPVKTFGHNATHTLSGTFSTQKGTNLADLPQLLLPPAARMIGTNRGPFNIYYQYEQFLLQNPAKPNQGWGVFGRIGLSDGNPNPIQNVFFVGIGGTGLTRRRAADRFGVGYFRDGISKALKDAVSAPPISLQIKSEAGAEMFYNFAVTRWLGITPDLQIHQPTLATKDVNVFGAVRAKVSF